MAGLISLSGLLLSCNLTERELGDAPIGPPIQGGLLDTTSWARDSVSGNLRIFATPQRVKAGNKAKATVTAKAFDGNGNPVRGRVVRFAASLGTITALDTTDADGTATATYTAVPRNGEVRIMAAAVVADTLSRVGTSIQLEGLTVSVVPASTDTLVDREVPVIVSVTDGEGEPVAAAAVSLTGTKESSGVTDGAGRFRTTVVRKEQGQTRLRALSAGAGDSVTVAFWSTLPDSRSRTILLFAEPSRIPAANGSTAKVKAVVYDDKHNPVEGRTVSFSASHGIISAQGTTNAQGIAEASFQGLAQNVDATLTATVSMEDSVRRATATLSMAGLQVELRPAATEVKIGETVDLSIRVRDADGNPVPNARVTLAGASQSSVTTNSSGVAAATVTSSGERAVPIKASALGGSDSARVVFLTELPGGPQASKQGVGNMRVFVDNSTLRASNTDQTTVRIIAFDRFNNPLSGRLVRFTANHGIITGSDTTDARGEASATYRSVPINIDARITATMVVDDSALAVATTVTLSGLEVDIRPQTVNALLNRQVPVDIRLVDGAGHPVPDATIQFNGNPGVGTTDGDGVFRTSVTSGSQKRILITANALGARDTSHVDFWTALPDPGDGEVTTIRRMRIFSSRSQLRADNSDFAAITVILTNEHNNPAVGETVQFTSNLGIIGETARVDSSGRATVTLKATPVNGVAKVEAKAVGRNLSAATEVLFSGVTLQMAPDRTELKVGETAAIEAFLKDASGNPIGGDEVSFALSGTNATFDNGDDAYSVFLNPNGRALVRVTASTSGQVKVRASALNTSDSLDLVFSNNTLTLAVSKPTLLVGGLDSTLVTATYVNGSGSPVPGASIAFASNAGTVAAKNATTDAQGRASTWLRSATFSGTATVQANSPTGTAQIPVQFIPAAVAKISLTVTADNIAVNGGVATLRAVLSDLQGNTISDSNVSFRILKGPGGGEAITKPVVKTQAGIAQSQLRAGSVASSYRGVLVEASYGQFADTTKLTISGAAHIVSVARPQDDTAKVDDAGVIDQSVFEIFVGAVVQDINGNMVADGTEVHFSASITGMAIYRRIFNGWLGLGSDSASVLPTYRLSPMDLHFEDINDNKIYDKGIDLVLDGIPDSLRRGEDRNGDGIFDWDPRLHAFWYDFNGNGRCDENIGEPTITVDGEPIFADIYPNGNYDASEVIVDVDPAAGPQCTLPASGDFPYHRWEAREWLPALPFTDNHFAVAVEVSAVTKNGVAQARIRYPRQFNDRLYATINAEVNGVRDPDGERFLLFKIVKD